MALAHQFSHRRKWAYSEHLLSHSHKMLSKMPNSFLSHREYWEDEQGSTVEIKTRAGEKGETHSNWGIRHSTKSLSFINHLMDYIKGPPIKLIRSFTCRPHIKTFHASSSPCISALQHWACTYIPLTFQHPAHPKKVYSSLYRFWRFLYKQGDRG